MTQPDTRKFLIHVIADLREFREQMARHAEEDSDFVFFLDGELDKIVQNLGRDISALAFVLDPARHTAVTTQECDVIPSADAPAEVAS